MTERRSRHLAVLLAASTWSAAALLAQGHDVVVPYVPPPQDNRQLNDPVTRLARRMESGAVSLTTGPVAGVLPGLLRELQIPVSSQVLVFSKTSLQHEFITPRTPRAIYFNDDVYVGFAPDGSSLELSSVDPRIGAVFYTLGQRAGARPALVTTPRCLQCHATAVTDGVPGHLMRSVFVRPDGTIAPNAPGFLTDHRSPIEERFGGWFVTGTLAGDRHMGNALLSSGQDAASFDRGPGTAITNVSRLFYADRYLSPHSDVVALMVLAHQARMHNLMAKLHREAAPATAASGPAVDPASRSAVPEHIEEIVRYMLFVDEAPLAGPVTGSTTFSADFERIGPLDGKQRSLRQFDLRARLFRYPCSYLIYSSAFLALPSEVKAAIYARLAEVLSGRDTGPAFARLGAAERLAIAEILRATHREFAEATAIAMRPSSRNNLDDFSPRILR
jgi:hypothetical protein